MSAKFLQRFAAKSGATPASVPTPDEPDVVDDCGAFGCLRGRERAIMLELRKTNGNILAVALGYLDRAEFDPSEGITLHLGDLKIRIRGRNLNAESRPNARLFQAITQHRVCWLRELGQAAAMQAGRWETVIEGIEW